MEYTDYCVGKGTVGEVRRAIEATCNHALILDDDWEGFVPFVATQTEGFHSWDFFLTVFDAEGGAWGFDLYIKGEQIGHGVYGENSEWGIDLSMNGFEGQLDAVASALGCSSSEVEATLNFDAGVEAFCKLVGFEHAYMLYPHEDQMPPGVNLMSDFS